MNTKNLTVSHLEIKVQESLKMEVKIITVWKSFEFSAKNSLEIILHLT